MKNRVYTVKEIADLLNIDKQKVYRFIKANNIQNETLEVLHDVPSEALQKAHQKNTKYYSEESKNIVFKALSKHTETNQKENVETLEVLHDTLDETLEVLHEAPNETLETLVKTIESLNKQLENKDKQINEKDEQIKRLQDSLDRALLVAYSNNVKQIEESPKEEEEPKKKGFLERLKGIFR